jgi:predicted dehydrogenase
MTQPISLALLGVGRWGNHLLRNFLAHPQLQVRAVVEASETQLTDIAQRFKLGPEVALLTDWQAAYDLPGLAAVAIATPAATHADLITAALQRRLHVLAEKPLTLAAESSAALCRLAAAQQRQLLVDHTYLFHPVVQAGRQQLDRVGQRRYGYAARTNLGPVRQDVDALWDLAIHDIAIFNHWLAESPCRVQAQGMTWQQPQRVQPPLFPEGLADVVWCRLQYPSGFQATIHLCWANPDKQRRLCVVGDQGTLIFDELQPQPLTLQTGRLRQQGQAFLPEALETVVLPVDPAEPLRQMCDHFVESVLQNQPSSVSSGWVGADLVRSLEALSRSLHQDGQWMTVAEV